ncbi:MAG TPA: Uma2 family endonuclease [Thermoanaerobaculia bacterium]|nr:Uma2 family endonuclease [Thermoanaerobaculia bacterium]
MATNPNQRLSIQEYLLLERQSETKNDFLDGEMFAMTGASRGHNRITINLSSSLYSQLAGGPCEVFASDMRVRTPTDLLTYPDIVAVCGEPRFNDAEFDTLLNPKLVVEVLSKSTEAYDRLTKLDHYRTIPGLEEIVFVAQERVRIEHWRRQADGSWLVEELAGLSQTLELVSVSCSLPLATVYRRVFEP